MRAIDAAQARDDQDAAVSCASCTACCCRLEVMLMGDDDVPAASTRQDRWGGWVMRRLDDGWCIALDRRSMLCTIYERRPGVCRDYPVGEGDCMVERTRHLNVMPISPRGDQRNPLG